MVKVLVTGGRRIFFRLVISTYTLVIGSGFVGVPTIKQLIANDHTVEATVRSEAKAVQANQGGSSQPRRFKPRRFSLPKKLARLPSASFLT